MQSKTWHNIAFSLFVLVCLLVMAANVALVWIATGPRSLTRFNSYIENALTPESKAYTVSIRETQLLWDGWKHPIDIRVKGVRLLLPNGSEFAAFPEISVAFDIPHLLVGSIEPSSLVVYGANVQLLQREDGELTFGFSNHSAKDTLPIKSVMSPFYENADTAKPSTIDSISIQHATFSVHNKMGKEVIVAPDARFTLTRNRKGFSGEISMIMQQNKDISVLHAELGWSSKDNRFGLISQFTGLRTNMISELYSLPAFVTALNGAVDGSVVLTGTLDGTIERSKFALVGKKSSFAYPDLFEKPISLDYFMLKGGSKQGFNTVFITDSLLRSGATEVKSRGALSKQGEDYGLNFVSDGTHMPVNDLQRYWPKGVAALTRDWVVQNVREGLVQDGTVTVNFNPGELRLARIPEPAISARIHVKDTSVAYLETYPKISSLNGALRFTGTSMVVDVDHARYATGTVIKSGQLTIPDLNLDHPKMHAKLDVSGMISDAVSFMEQPEINEARELNLSSKQIKGIMDAVIDLHITLFSPHAKNPFDGVVFSVSATLAGAGQNKFMQKYDLTDTNAELVLSNEHMKIKGITKINAANVQFEAEHFFVPEKSYDSRYQVHTAATTDALNGMGFSVPSQVKGVVGITATVTDKAHTKTMDAVLDLTGASLDLSDFSWKKQAGVAAIMKAKAIQDGNAVLQVKDFSFDGAGLKIAGTAALNANGDLLALRCDSLRFGKNDFAVAYGTEGAGKRVEIKGNTLDLSGYEGNSEDFSISRFSNLNARILLDRVLLKSGVLNHIEAELDCGASRCTHALLKGSEEKNTPFQFTIDMQGSSRLLEGKVDNTGNMLRTLGMYSDMQGGTLLVSGKFDDNREGNPLIGKIRMGEYSLRNAPLLTRILTIASLTGAVDTLQGKGISFTRLSAPFMFKRDMVMFKDAKSYGPALGLTAEGSIDLKKKQMNVHGTIVPSYTLNSVFGKIPLIGEVLAGGKDQGLFAARYTLKGTYEQPEISLNPLSILTPGFLRNLFDIFNGPKKEADVDFEGFMQSTASDSPLPKTP